MWPSRCINKLALFSCCFRTFHLETVSCSAVEYTFVQKHWKIAVGLYAATRKLITKRLAWSQKKHAALIGTGPATFSICLLGLWKLTSAQNETEGLRCVFNWIVDSWLTFYRRKYIQNNICRPIFLLHKRLCLSGNCIILYTVHYKMIDKLKLAIVGLLTTHCRVMLLRHITNNYL